jgi:hypothetical protein
MLLHENQDEIRPWGLLNGRLINNRYEYGVANPIEAIMSTIAKEYRLM